MREHERRQGAERPGEMAHLCGRGVTPKKDKAGKGVCVAQGWDGAVHPQIHRSTSNPSWTPERDCVWRWVFTGITTLNGAMRAGLTQRDEAARTAPQRDDHMGTQGGGGVYTARREASAGSSPVGTPISDVQPWGQETTPVCHLSPSRGVCYAA